MFDKISIIGCGLIGSSILRATQEKKPAITIIRKSFIAHTSFCTSPDLLAQLMLTYQSCT